MQKMLVTKLVTAKCTPIMFIKSPIFLNFKIKDERTTINTPCKGSGSRQLKMPKSYTLKISNSFLFDYLEFNPKSSEHFHGIHITYPKIFARFRNFYFLFNPCITDLLSSYPSVLNIYHSVRNNECVRLVSI
jgi:hypothetical protein